MCTHLRTLWLFTWSWTHSLTTHTHTHNQQQHQQAAGEGTRKHVHVFWELSHSSGSSKHPAKDGERRRQKRRPIGGRVGCWGGWGGLQNVKFATDCILRLLCLKAPEWNICNAIENRFFTRRRRWNPLLLCWDKIPGILPSQRKRSNGTRSVETDAVVSTEEVGRNTQY